MQINKLIDITEPFFHKSGTTAYEPGNLFLDKDSGDLYLLCVVAEQYQAFSLFDGSPLTPHPADTISEACNNLRPYPAGTKINIKLTKYE